MSLSQPTHAVASHTRWACVFGSHCSPFTAQLLLLPSWRVDLTGGRAWNAGRHAPGVTLWLEFDAPVTTLRLYPRMAPTEGVVGLVVVIEGAERIAHRAFWRDCEWVAIALPTAARALRIEFVESPSWI
jgi:hypothetical protein